MRKMEAESVAQLVRIVVSANSLAEQRIALAKVDSAKTRG
jgi:hypothetical protein